jgi:hypothetical protein
VSRPCRPGAWSPIVVVDATRRGRGPGLVQRLRNTGLQARAGRPAGAVDGLLVVLLPIVAAGDPPPAAVGVVGSLDDTAASSHQVDLPRTVVVAWFVEKDARVSLPRRTVTHGPCSRDAAALLNADAWADEMRTHGDPYAAAECRSAQLRTLLAGESSEPADVVLVAEAHRAALRLDPGYLTALCVEADTGQRRQWRDEASVVSAIHARLPRPDTVFDSSL